MCHWQHKDGCVGSKCQYQMGLSFYHYSCKDCKCVKEPWRESDYRENDQFEGKANIVFWKGRMLKLQHVSMWHKTPKISEKYKKESKRLS